MERSHRYLDPVSVKPTEQENPVPTEVSVADLDLSEESTNDSLVDEIHENPSRHKSEEQPNALPVTPERGLQPTDPLGQYMAELRKHSPITREEEHSLAVRWIEHGDRDAGRQLVLANLRLVVKIAMEYRRNWASVLDLIQEGNLGLVQAVQRFDPYQGTKLSSYAVYWIRAYILKYLIDNIRLVRMGSSRAERKLFFRLNKEKRELERRGFEVEPKLLAERLDVTEDDVTHMEQRLSEGEISFETPVSQAEDGAVFGDFIEGEIQDSEAKVANAELQHSFMEHVKIFAEGLKEREQEIVNRRILADDPETLQDLGQEFGVSRERIRQLENKIVSDLREYLREKVVDFDYYLEED